MAGARRKLAGRYELVEVIGRGGMGIVYRATDLRLGRTVAVKVLAAALANEDSNHIARFEREARAAASLAHPAVVAVYDTGADEATRFIVMEYAAGRSLAAILRDEAPLELHRAATIAERMADALGAAHAAGIVHRDVKPANVMVADDGSVKVLDFGLARALDGTALTQTDAVLGTAAYMAPEQALGERVDERSDIYSLGCVLYAMLTGRPPFTGEVAAAIAHQHVNIEPRAPCEVNRRVPPPLDALVLQLLAKSPADRPQSAAQVGDRLRKALTAVAAEGRGPTSATASASTAATVPVKLPAAPTRVPAARVANRRLVTVAAPCAAALVIAVFALASGGRPRPRTSTAPAHTARRAPAGGSRTRSTRPSGSISTPAASTDTASLTTVSAAAADLKSLVAQDLESGRIDQRAAQQITNAVVAILNSYGMGRGLNAEHELTDLLQRMAMLEAQGHISSAAAAPVNSALSSLSSALARSTAVPPQPPATPSGPPAQPPASEPSGDAKTHGDSHEHKHGKAGG